MKQKEHSKVWKRNVVIAILIVVIVLVLIVAALVFGLFRGDGQDMSEQTQWGEFQTGENMSEMVSAYGVTSIGTTEIEFPIETLENRLEIEEVYLSSGEEVTAGAALFKLTEESVNTVKTELEETLRAADLAYRAGYIEYEQSKITSYYDKEETVLSGQYADAVYNETISGLYDAVEKAKEELDEAKEQIAEYETAIANNSYYEEYKVGYYKDLYDENLEILKARMDEWGVSWSEVVYGGSSGGSAGGSSMMRSSISGGGGVSSGDNGQSMHSQYVTVLSGLYKVLEQNLADYEQALSDYEDASENASFNLQTLKLQLSSLEEKYAEAKENYDNSILQAELTKETTLYNAEKADSTYETDMEKAESDYEELADAREEAQSNLDLFNELVKDNCYYAQDEGTILRMSARSGEEIGAGSRLYTLRDEDEMTVTVSVSQEDIAKLAVGDSAFVYSTESGTYQGVITAISPISSSSSKTSITYSVTVSLSGDLGNLEINETVIVYFGMGKGAQGNE